MSKQKTKQNGFTLIEILVVVVILGILGAIVVPNLLARPDAARVQAAQTDIRQLAAALDVYRLDNFQYPSSEQGLEALVEKPSGFPEPPNWKSRRAISRNCKAIRGAQSMSMSGKGPTIRFSA